MPARIPLSHVKHLGNFDQLVTDYGNAIKEWAMRPADWDMCPPPSPPHPLVAIAAHVGGYEIVDDTPPPPPPPSLDEHKNQLVEEVKKLHAEAQKAVLPPLKRPLIELQSRRAHETRWENRTLGDREALNNRRGIEARLAANDLHLAEQLAAIDDLTETTIGSWKPVPFADAPAPVEPTLEEKRQIWVSEIDAELRRATDLVDPPLKRNLRALLVRNADAKPEDKRTKADLEVIGENDQIRNKISALELHAATLKAELAEIDGNVLASWKPAAFPI